MKREIREVDHERGILKITTQDERFYGRQVMGMWDFVPSVTWIADFFPKGVGFYKWLATKGWSEAEEIKAAAGDKGSKVHQAISLLLAGGKVSFEDSFENPRSLEQEELNPTEYECLMSFVEWFDAFKPQVIAFDYTVWNERYRYAGTIDLKCRLNIDNYKHPYIVDFKTSLDIWPPHELQVSAYKHAEPDHKQIRTAILQVGYRRNKSKKWKFTPINDKFQLFLAARKIWAHECENVKPLQKDYPLELSLLPSIDSTEMACVSGVEESQGD